MTSRIQNLLAIIGFVLGVSLLTVFAPLVYFGLPVTSSVVDAATGQPVAGVMVIAYCTLSGAHGSTSEQAMVMEAVTNKDGGFHFPWWGPSFGGRLRAAECPSLLFYKNGYRNAFRGNGGLAAFERRMPAMVHYLDHQDRPTKIEKLTGGVEEEFVEFRKFNDRLNNIVGSESPCEWRPIPRTIKLLIDLRKYFEANGKKVFGFNSLDRYLYFRGHGCGSGENFYESLIK